MIYDLKKLKDYVYNRSELGPMPDDIEEYLAYLSIGGPAILAYRCYLNMFPKSQNRKYNYRLAATQTAFGIISLFNKEETERLLSYWFNNIDGVNYIKAVIKYCVYGDLQAVLEEYCHLLKTAGYDIEKKPGSFSIVDHLIEVLGFKTTKINCVFKEHKTLFETENKYKNSYLRCHYAVPLGNQKQTDDAGVQRIGNIRDAFNSPFRPFMLNSTSIGQEGLDFHWYCRRVIHWNIPGNPIEIEQREGRIDRYKSLLIRKRIAADLAQEEFRGNGDIWEKMFAIANDKTKNNRHSDLIPYWYYPDTNEIARDIKIERFVLALPLSKDIDKYKNALKIISLYRLAFGQPRQEEFLNNLIHKELSDDQIDELYNTLVINLCPLTNNDLKKNR